jgi:hypothetical protein
MIPIYEVTFDENQDHGMSMISLVSDPAIQEVFVAFDKEDTDMKFVFADQEKRQVMGPIIVPDRPIFRRDRGFGDFYIVFSKDTIEKMMLDYSKKGLHNAFNIEHGDSAEGVTLTEVWMKEFDQDKSNAYGYDLPVGTVFVKAQVESDEVWNDIKSNGLNGFSIEMAGNIVEHKMSNEMDFKFAVELGERIAKLEALVSKIADDHYAVMELWAETQQKLSAEGVEAEKETVTEEVAVEQSSEEAPVTEEVVAEAADVEAEELTLASEADADAVAAEETLSKEEEVSVEDAEIALSNEQEGLVADEQVVEDKTRSFERITSDKVKMINKFLGKSLY